MADRYRNWLRTLGAPEDPVATDTSSDWSAMSLLKAVYGQFLAGVPVTSGGTGTVIAFTAGSIVFAGAAGVYTQDNANLFWDNSNNRLGVGIATPATPLDVNGTATALAYSITAPSGALSVLPVGNALTTKSSISVQGNRQSSTVREFMASFGMTSTVGFSASSYNQDGVALYAGVDGQTGSGDIWAFNTVTNMAANLSNDINAQGYELDFNNVYKAYTTLSPLACGMSISGAGTFLSSAALLITGTISSLGVNPIWTMGLVLAGPSIRDYSIYDATNSVTAHLVQGAHTHGVEMSGATFSGNAFASPSFSVTGAGAVTAAFATIPIVIGGTGTTSTLQLRPTSGVGTTNADIIFQVGSNGATEAMRILNSTAVLIGHTAALITKTATTAVTPKGQLTGLDATAAALLSRFSADALGPTRYFGKSRGATAGSYTVVQSADVLGSLSFAGADGTDMAEGARISAIVSGTPGAGDMPTDLVFYTSADGSESPTERMRIDLLGNVGIGASPLGRLHVVHALDDEVLYIQNSKNNGGTTPLVYIQDDRGFSAVNSGNTISVSTNTTGGANTGAILRLANSAGVVLWVGMNSNTKIAGTALRGTTEGTNHLDIFDGTAPVGTLANGCSIYSTAGELRVMDAAGNATLISPHDSKTNEWIYHSVDTRIGKGLRIDMERMMRAINERFGWDFVHEFTEAA